MITAFRHGLCSLLHIPTREDIEEQLRAVENTYTVEGPKPCNGKSQTVQNYLRNHLEFVPVLIEGAKRARSCISGIEDITLGLNHCYPCSPHLHADVHVSEIDKIAEGQQRLAEWYRGLPKKVGSDVIFTILPKHADAPATH